MLKGFKDFLLRGNIVMLAVAFVMGLAFAEVIDALVGGLIDPIVALILGNSANGINGVGIDIGEQTLNFGTIISALITFVATAGAIYFLVVVPMNKMMEARKNGDDDVELTNEERMIELLEQIAAKQ